MLATKQFVQSIHHYAHNEFQRQEVGCIQEMGGPCICVLWQDSQVHVTHDNTPIITHHFNMQELNAHAYDMLCDPSPTIAYYFLSSIQARATNDKMQHEGPLLDRTTSASKTHQSSNVWFCIKNHRGLHLTRMACRDCTPSRLAVRQCRPPWAVRPPPLA